MTNDSDVELLVTAIRQGLLSAAQVALLLRTQEATKESLAETMKACGILTSSQLDMLRSYIRSDSPTKVLGNSTKPAGDGADAPTVPMQSPPPIGGTVNAAVFEVPGRYEFVREHGRGGMGRVLCVHDTFLSRDVALKEMLVIEPSAPTTRPSSAYQRFETEARIAAGLEHPSIVPVYELGRRDDGSVYYTMRLVTGETLRKAIAEAQNLEERLGLLNRFVDICNGIAYAHSQNIIHRDIKPDNILLGDFGETIILDWGLAKSVGTPQDDSTAPSPRFSARSPSPGTATEEGQVLGTPAYMAPEQASGVVAEIDHRTDIYSLGALLYELLTRRAPYSGSSADIVVGEVIAKSPKPIRDLAPDAPAELVSICQRAMARDKNQRFQSAKDLSQEVQKFLTGAVVGSHRYKAVDHVSRVLRRLRVLSSAAAFLFMMTFGMFFYVAAMDQPVAPSGIRDLPWEEIPDQSSLSPLLIAAGILGAIAAVAALYCAVRVWMLSRMTKPQGDRQ